MKKKDSWHLIKMICSFYRNKIEQLSLYCGLPDKHKTAFAIASAICLGITPIFGFTLLLVTVFGLVFRLNQFVMQAVHIMVSPLQVLLFFPFMQAGKWMFGLKETTVIKFEDLPGYIYHNSSEFIHQYLRVFLAGTIIWFLVSLVSGYCIYRYIWWRLGESSTKKKGNPHDSPFLQVLTINITNTTNVKFER
jgi:uncharacterized protein (DUF2062 family)